MKTFGCYRGVGNGVAVCAARSKEEAYGAMVIEDSSLMYDYRPEDFFEIENLYYDGNEPKLIIEGGKE